MKIVVLDGYAANPGDVSWDAVAALGELKVYDRTPVSEIPARIEGAEIVLTNKAPLTRETLEGAKSLKLISVLATGYNIVDTAAAKELGITVCNVPGYSTMSVAQLVFAFVLELTHHVGLHTESIMSGGWVKSPDFAYWCAPIWELDGKTLGVYGYGTIGKAVAKIGAAFGMKVVATSRSHQSGGDGVAEFVSPDELFARADVISFHCPLTPETKGLVGGQTIAKMKRGVVIINTSRGPVIDEAALRAALEDGRVGGAGIDVISSEPMKADNPLLGAPNCVMTPHIGWATAEARVRLMDVTAKNIAAYKSGSAINVVNK